MKFTAERLVEIAEEEYRAAGVEMDECTGGEGVGQWAYYSAKQEYDSEEQVREELRALLSEYKENCEEQNTNWMEANGVRVPVDSDNLEDAKKEADDWIDYCQRDLFLHFDGVTYRRKWWGCMEGIKECEDPISFSDWGFYGDWVEDEE